jgi:hypothetical protein
MPLLPENLLIQLSTKIHPTENEFWQMNELLLQIRDWDYLAKTAIEHQAGPLLYKKLPLLSNQPKIPGFVQVKLKQAWLKTLSRSMILIDHFKKIAEAFKTESIPFIAMKGIFLSDWLYSEIGLRQFSDLDLLVKEEDGKRCLRILSLMGYESSGLELPAFVREHSDIIHFPPMVKNGVSVEIHIKIHCDSAPYHVDVRDLWSHAKSVTIHGEETLAFDCNDLLLHLCLHLDKHFCNGKVQFTCFYDIANLLNQHTSDIDWERFKETCLRYKAMKQTYPYILLLSKYSNAPVPEAIKEEFSRFLSSRKERHYLGFLAGKVYGSTVPGVFRSLKRSNNPIKSLRFLFGMVFPPKKYMINRYHIRKQSFIFFYYFYRIFIGVKVLGGAIVNVFR